VSRLMWRRLPMPLALLVGGALISGCSGEENIPLKKVDFVIETPKDYKEQRKQFQPMKGSSAAMKRDPSGMHPN
jgi:hypothetical protein